MWSIAVVFELPETEGPMRMLVAFAIAVAVVAIGFGMKTVFHRGFSVDLASISSEMAAAKTLWPHEIHLKYQSTRELPVHEIKDPL
jgi:hypothetical protein